ncbi:unannotated protein [freshwater metagenome]|uniref:Unannotated protein n=1 Tax=freshwater metagenome TaxID=449393 RepID=A0A6J6YQC3_9ZZZZ
MLLHPLSNLDSASIWRDDDRVLGIGADVLLDDRHGGQVVDWSVKETLNLSAVEVNGDHALGSGRFKEIGDETSGNRFTSFSLAVLTGVTVKRTHRSDALGRSALSSINHDQLLHDGVIDRTSVAAEMALHDENVRTTDAFTKSRAHFAVGKFNQIVLTELNT